MKRVIIALSAIVTLLTAPAGFPCTTFVLKDDGRIYFGRNLDWECEDGLIIANPRGLRKTALVDPGHPAAQWTSKYGSLTFNQFGWEAPFGGMNEAGLVVEEMTLMESRYPTPDARPEIDMLQWIQYQLDSCSNVAEVIATDARIRQPEPTVPIRIHYQVCDASGDRPAMTSVFQSGRQRRRVGDLRRSAMHSRLSGTVCAMIMLVGCVSRTPVESSALVGQIAPATQTTPPRGFSPEASSWWESRVQLGMTEEDVRTALSTRYREPSVMSGAELIAWAESMATFVGGIHRDPDLLVMIRPDAHYGVYSRQVEQRPGLEGLARASEA